MSPAVPRAAHVPVQPDSLLGRERVHPRRANLEEVSETMDCVSFSEVWLQRQILDHSSLFSDVSVQLASLRLFWPRPYQTPSSLLL